MKQALAHLLVGVVACTVLLALPAHALAADSGLTIELLPNSVTTQTGRPSHVLLIVRNGGPDATGVTLNWLDPSPASVKPAADSFKPIALPQGADHAWPLTITTPVGAPASKVLFRVDYVAGKQPHINTAALDVANAAPTTADEVASVEIKTTLESLDRQHSGLVYLLVTNKLPVPLTVANVTAAGPDFVEFTAPAKPVIIPARQQIPIKVVVAAKDRVRTGKYLLLFAAQLRWSDGDQFQTARVVTTQQTQVGVVGESAVLTLLGVPSFLLIPGFLIVLTIATLWKFRKPVGAGDFPLEVGKPDFWVIAITISIAVAFIYPHAGGVDYLSGTYGLQDVVWIWVASLVIGSVVYGIYTGWRSLRQAWRVPTENDSQPTIVAKVARQRLELQLPRYAFGQGASAYTGFLIQPRQAGAANVWFAPRILVSVKENVADGQKLLKTLEAENNPKRLAKMLHQRRHDLTFAWEAGGGPSHAYPRAAADYEAAVEQTPDRLVRSS